MSKRTEEYLLLNEHLLFLVSRAFSGKTRVLLSSNGFSRVFAGSPLLFFRFLCSIVILFTSVLLSPFRAGPIWRGHHCRLR
ncbi:hypothetical protein MA16_Dca012610 [Dendrobium catenatum]|uniref:Uncharacterized protein n=1 Tax=Dendrobium catenatum TaxID=906689 RepID=A0A2I0VKT1_9ASPA|nr:hypothetical protein MA16_Dca012610 [Dendrobium catenatum]